MMTSFRYCAAAAATFSVMATPVAATDFPVSTQRSAYAQSGYDAGQDKAERYRSRHRYHRGRYRDRVDAGDVIAGIAIIGGIAAIASAIDSKNRRDRGEERRYDDRRYDAPRQYRSGSLDQAVNACTREVERDMRVDQIDNVSRVGDGWEVRGRLFNGNGFTCAVSGSGRIDRIDYGGGFGASATGDNSGAYDRDVASTQFPDDTYARARAAQSGAYVPQPAPAQAQPAYPGGPLPGEEIDGDLGG